MNRLLAVIYAGAAAFIGWQAVRIALGPKGDASGWVLALIFAGVAAFLARSAWKDWNKPGGQIVSPAAHGRASPAMHRNPALPAVPLEDQIAALAEAGLILAPGRTVEELRLSWGDDYYESDPYGLLLFMYGGEVEAEPWGRFFCERGWNLDMECLEQAGDYARAFREIVRITGRPDLVTDLTDDFSLNAQSATIRYTINGQPRALQARVDNDWADPEAVTTFVRDVEAAVGDGRRFWASDNGQSSTLLFITGAEAAKINALRPDLLERYTGA